MFRSSGVQVFGIIPNLDTIFVLTGHAIGHEKRVRIILMKDTNRDNATLLLHCGVDVDSRTISDEHHNRMGQFTWLLTHW